MNLSSQMRGQIENARLALKKFCFENKWFVRLWLGYMLGMTIIYVVANKSIPYGGWNLYNYFNYTFKVNAIPDLNFRSGYPPLGILPYFVLTLLLNGTQAYLYYSSIMNALAMSFSMLFMYLSLLKIFGRSLAFRSSVLFAVLPSLGLTAFYSNDPLALLMIMISVYFMVVRRNSVLTGIFIGLGALTKIYPIFLAIPALAFFKTKKDSIRLAYSIIATIFFVSLPFLVTDPFMYTTVFLHHTLRGPSDTIYALIEGFHGSTGFLHPDFDQFLYFWQLIQIYPPLPNDYAIYRWNVTFLPRILFISQAAVLGICYAFLRKKNGEENAVKGVGLTMLSYILLSFVFSPQFAVFVIPIMIISVRSLRAKILLCVLMEAATEIQLLLWGSSLFSYISLPILSFEIMLRTTAIILAIGLILLQLKRGRSNE